MVEEWFTDWFNSPYYHLLYNDRNEEEADNAVKKLISFLKPEPNCYMLDLACGKGRHAQVLNSLGYTVTGLDIAPASIDDARKFENKKLSFYIHDMRQSFGVGMYDYVFNFFTSFGYFNNLKENEKVLYNINTSLRKNGTLVIDFLNAELINPENKNYEEKENGGVCFKWCKRKENGNVLKTINFSDKGHDYEFTEKVQLITLNDFKKMLNATNFKIVNTFGDYNLNSFVKENSPRLIIVARKIN